MSVPRAEDAVEQLFELYADDIYRYARSVLLNEADAKDVVQDVFCKALVAYAKFRHESSAKTWLWQIARNQLRDVLRQRKREASRRSAEALDGVDSPDNLELAVELRELIRGLKVGQREIVTLRMVQGMSNAEAATVLGWSEAKVKSTLHRAVQKLRDALADMPPPGASQTAGQWTGVNTAHELKGGSKHGTTR